VFGSPDHPRITIHFLNAVLQPPQPITSVEILNPIQGQDRSQDKLAILDILAQDATGCRFNIEMQTTLPVDLTKRLTYYNWANRTTYFDSVHGGRGVSWVHGLRKRLTTCQRSGL